MLVIKQCWTVPGNSIEVLMSSALTLIEFIVINVILANTELSQ